MKSDNHYEAAFDAYLRGRGVAVVPVVEARRSYLDADEVKSPDFIVLAPGGAKLVVDVKGRKFPGTGKGGKPRNVWHNWCEREDVDSLIRWADRFGGGFRGVCATAYRSHMRTRSPRWGTVHVLTDDFRELVKPISHFLAPAADVVELAR